MQCFTVRLSFNLENHFLYAQIQENKHIRKIQRIEWKFKTSSPRNFTVRPNTSPHSRHRSSPSRPQLQHFLPGGVPDETEQLQERRPFLYCLDGGWRWVGMSVVCLSKVGPQPPALSLSRETGFRVQRSPAGIRSPSTLTCVCMCMCVCVHSRTLNSSLGFKWNQWVS